MRFASDCLPPRWHLEGLSNDSLTETKHVRLFCPCQRSRSGDLRKSVRPRRAKGDPLDSSGGNRRAAWS